MSKNQYIADRFPFDPGPSGWNEILPKQKFFPTLEKNIKADVTIIGGGFAGLSAALRLKDINPKLNIVLLEAREIAKGPAGRNSGFMMDLPHHLASKNYAGNIAQDHLVTELNRSAIGFADSAVEKLNLPKAAFLKVGKINGAATQKGLKHNQDYAAHLSEMGEELELLSQDQMTEICGSDYYLGGLYTPGTVMLQPALYIRSLSQGISKLGVKIFENSAVKKFERTGKDWRVETENGCVSTGKVILANNGHIESFGQFKRQLVHIYLYASMTKSLTKSQEKALGGHEQWGFTPADPLGSTVRKISAKGGSRIVIRNGITWNPHRRAEENTLGKFKQRHADGLSKRFPKLGNLEMEYCWGGLLCLSMNSVPAFGEIDYNLYAACCQNGLGSAFGTLSGMTIADKLMGQENKATTFFDNLAEPSKLPIEPFSTIGANLRFIWGEWNAGAEI